MRHRGWMWHEAVALLERAERLQRQFFQHSGSRWEPPLDLLEHANGDVTLMVALPGVAPQHVTLEIEGCVLRVAGNRPWPRDAGAKVLRLEIPHGRFERLVHLPHGTFSLETHTLDHGCLTLRLRRH